MEKILIPLLIICFGCSQAESTDTQQPASPPSKTDTLSFILTEANNIVFEAVLDNRDSITLFFDTGGTEIVLRNQAIKENTSLLEGKNEGYEEENYVPLEGVYSLAIGNLNWDSLSIFPTVIGPEEADGHFGWDLFKGKVVELDYDHQYMVVHDSPPPNLESYSKLEIEYTHTLFCIKASAKVGETVFPNRYLFDTGFQRSVILDKDLRQQSAFPDTLPVIKESKLRNGAGTEFINRVVKVDQICFGNSCAPDVPVQLFAAPNPARFETHFLGNELLKRFSTILDFQNGFVYMKPNSLMGLPYQDAS